MPIADVLQKPIDHRRGNHVGNALRDIAAVTLKGNADHFGVLHYRSAAVAGIDLRADLNREVLIDRRMSVELEIDPRNDARCDRHAFAADRVAVSRDGGFELRNTAKL